eukprot:2259117-Amphidinium_carterae.1
MSTHKRQHVLQHSSDMFSRSGIRISLTIKASDTIEVASQRHLIEKLVLAAPDTSLSCVDEGPCGAIVACPVVLQGCRTQKSRTKDFQDGCSARNFLGAHILVYEMLPTPRRAKGFATHTMMKSRL